MRVVLLKDFATVGRRNDVKNVSDGYAFNFLIPQGIAETATSQALAKVELIKKQEIEKKKIRQDLMLKSFDELKGIKVQIAKPANKEGHLFAAIHATEIAEAVKEQTRLDLDPDCLVLTEHVKKAGEHEIEVKVGDRVVKFTLEVLASDEERKK